MRIKRDIIMSALLILSLSLGGTLTGGCDVSPKSSFPALITEQTKPVDPTETNPVEPVNPDEWDEPVYLSLAVPFGKEAAESIRLLFLARESGLAIDASGNYIGSDVTRDELSRFDAPLILDVQTVSSDEGVLADDISIWKASAGMPDLLYCSRAAVAPGLDQVLPLDDLLYNHPLLTPEWVFAPAVDSIRKGQTLLGIPYLASIPLICYNMDLLNQLRLEALPIDPTWSEWQAWMESVQRTLSDAGLSAAPEDLVVQEDDFDAVNERLKQAVFVHDDLSDFLPLIPASLAPAGWAMWNGYTFRFDDNLFRLSASWLRDRVQSGLSPAHLNNSQRSVAFSDTTTPRLDNRVISWTIDSTDLAYWHQQSQVAVGESLIPHGLLVDQNSPEERSSDARMPIDVRCLVINRDSVEPEWATRLAAFIALDPDALLMQSRYQIYEGLYPVVDDMIIWKALVDRQVYGRRTSQFRDRFSNAAVSGRQLVEQWDEVMTQVLGDAGNDYLTAEETADLDVLFRNIQTKAGQILQEGD